MFSDHDETNNELKLILMRSMAHFTCMCDGVMVCKALEDVMQSVAAIQSELHVDRVDICTTTELELD